MRKLTSNFPVPVESELKRTITECASTVKFWSMGASGRQELLGRSQEYDNLRLSVRMSHDLKKINSICSQENARDRRSHKSYDNKYCF